ncbi:MAG TPA: DUF885 family protein [Vicinamibacterales bacterium]|nr:DUF885 family protein [Vicinamibacterales bacterium]
MTRKRPLFRFAVATACTALSALTTAAQRPPAAIAAAARPAQATQRWEVVRYNRVLQRRHFDIDSAQLVALGRQEYQRLESEMIALAKQIDPTKDWSEIVRQFERANHPRTVRDIVPAYQRELQRAKAFVLGHDLVSLPAAGDLAVRETPPNLVAITPYARYRWDDDVLLVTLNIGDANGEGEALQSNNDGLIATGAVHEAYPGHRVQHLIRPGGETNEDTETFSEGWGLYSEELMLRLGYYDDRSRETRLYALRMLLWRAARALLDAQVNRGDIPAEAAIRFLVDKVGLSETRARLEVTSRYVGVPGSAATYLVGKRQIEQLRRQLRAREGERFSLKQFHDRLLAQDMAPLQTIARKAFQMELEPAGILQVDAGAQRW